MAVLVTGRVYVGVLPTEGRHGARSPGVIK